MLAMPVLFLCLAANAPLRTRVLGGRRFEFLGFISCSVYLVHSPVRDVVEYSVMGWPFRGWRSRDLSCQ
jgi:peptidoglycan/LPS O-acetylase OafA/YrhL